MSNNWMRIIFTAVIIEALAIIGIAQRTRGTSSAISENALRAHIKFLSDDRLEGRGTGAKGGETAALYVAEQFEAMGLKGAGAKGSFWQDRKSTRLNSSHSQISYAVFCLKKKKIPAASYNRS